MDSGSDGCDFGWPHANKNECKRLRMPVCYEYQYEFFEFIYEIGSSTRTPRKKKAKDSPTHINRPVSY